MRIIIEKPPAWIYDKCVELFHIQPGVVFAYGDTIFNPDNVDLPEHIKVHEMVHSEQQGAQPDEWWRKYLSDPKFRIAQEIEAFRAQYKFGCRSITDKNARFRIIHTMAEEISKTYKEISYTDAITKLRK